MNSVIKVNDSGRVIPWNAFKDMLYKVYHDRIEDNSNILKTIGNNVNFLIYNFKTILLDEYLCIFMLNKFKLRRISEIKLLEFIVSLKYYLKTNLRALMFAKLLGVVPISKYLTNQNYFNSSVNDSSSLENQLAFKVDANLLNYYLYCFQLINDLPK
jgi:hypothetical protein